MSEEWKRYNPKLPIYDVLTKPGGITVERAMQRAEAAVENYRGQANTALEEEIGLLEAIVGSKNAADSDRIYKISSDILSISSMFQPPLCHAANSLCELVSRMRAAQRWDWPPVAVHVGAMRALFGKRDDRDPQVLPVLNGLLSIVARYADTTAAEKSATAKSA